MLFKSIKLPNHNPIPSHYPLITNLQSLRSFIDDIEINYIRDRGLDHAVEKEKDLNQTLKLKTLLKSEPTKSLPISSINALKDNLGITKRPIEFIRKYPSVFQEYFPANIGIHPHVRLTPETLEIDGEEQSVYGTETVRKSGADRLLKMLMLCGVNEIPLKLIDRFKWDLGLPDDYVGSLVPEFPDYFRVKGGNLLELVCWSDEMAVSVMEKRAAGESGYRKGMPVAFPLRFSNGFEMDKRLKKWVDEWQKLQYVSPYENASYLQPNSDESDKWTVGVLHELLHILVPKKTERDNVLCLGEYLGIRSRFKRALVHHPGIFYLSGKIGTYTVALREGYKRGLLVEKHPLMDIRNKYIHLMHTVKEVQRPKSVPGASSSKQQAVKEVGGKETQDGDDGATKDEEMQGDSCCDGEEESNDDDEEEVVEEKNESPRSGRRNGRRGTSKPNVGGRKPRRPAFQERLPRKRLMKT